MMHEDETNRKCAKRSIADRHRNNRSEYFNRRCGQNFRQKTCGENRNITKSCLKRHAATKIIIISRRDNDVKNYIMRLKRNLFDNNIRRLLLREKTSVSKWQCTLRFV